ncbi:MAG: hypothetical protein GF333_04360 [Candidatus Omnitrophica bacterium]|nr:hypothetical protein [Candidatus Omnitrophota bacterium]
MKKKIKEVTKMGGMRKLFLGAVCAVLCAGLAQPLFAGEIDILVQKLVEKGVLTYGEAQQIMTETKEELRTKMAKGEMDTLPSWVQNLKLKGDLRLRYQWEDKTGSEDRHRGRLRFRLGMQSKVNDKITVAAGLATGGSDPRSTNQTLQNTFDTPDIRLDYAYAQYAVTPWLTVKGGKISSIKKLIFRPSDLLWDSDINPEGLSAQMNYTLADGVAGFFNTGLWILDEDSGNTSDPFMYVLQPGVTVKAKDIGIASKSKFQLAVAYYGFNDVQGNTLDNAEGGPTLDANGNYAYDFNAVAPGFKWGLTEPLNGVIPYLEIFGDYVHNPDPDNDNNGWLAGVKFGDAKIKKWGDWQMKYMYRRLEADAWLDTFPDSDAFSGKTAVKGHEVALVYGVGKHTEVGLDYYQMERIPESDGRRHILQLDWKLKF